MKKVVSICDRKEIFEFKTDGTYKRYLDWDTIGNQYENNFKEISFNEIGSPEHEEISKQILRSIEDGEPLPNGVYNISAEIPLIQQFGMPLPKTRSNPVVITNWHIKPDMRVYQGETLHSSRIKSVEGNVVCTESGNYYILVGRDPAIRNVQNLLAPAGSPNDVYSSLNPLTPKSIVQLLLAEKLVYGDAKHSASLLLTSLHEIENNLISSNLADSTPFDSIKDILKSIGISIDTIPLCELPLTSQVSNASLLPHPHVHHHHIPQPVNIIYSLHHGHDTLQGVPFLVYSNITLRELFLRILFKHIDIFSSHLNLIEPFDGNLRLEWCYDERSVFQGQQGQGQGQGLEEGAGGAQGGGGWTPHDPETVNSQFNDQIGEKKLDELQFIGNMFCRVLFRT